MLDLLVLRLDAPLVSFGGPVVDSRGVTQDFPGQALLTGLMGNALGYEHQDAERLGRLQSRLRYAVRRDRRGAFLRDYQTVDLGQDFLSNGGWTTRGRAEGRAGGPAAEKTHIRLRDFRADSLYTVVLTLVPPDEQPDLDKLKSALCEPERPLFIGRKSCLPAARLFLKRIQAASLRQGLLQVPLVSVERRDEEEDSLDAWWPAEEGEEKESRLVEVTDERDWTHQIHSGRRALRHGRIHIREVSHDE